MASSSLEMQVPTHTSAHLRRAVDHGGMLSMTASGEYVTYPRDARLIAAAEEIALCTGLFFQSLFIAASDKYVGDRRKDADAEYLNTHPYDGSLEWVQRVFTTDRDFRRSHKGHPLEYFNSIFCLDPKDCYFWLGKASDDTLCPLPIAIPNPRLLYDQYRATDELYRLYLRPALLDVLMEYRWKYVPPFIKGHSALKSILLPRAMVARLDWSKVPGMANEPQRRQLPRLPPALVRPLGSPMYNMQLLLFRAFSTHVPPPDTPTATTALMQPQPHQLPPLPFIAMAHSSTTVPQYPPNAPTMLAAASSLEPSMSLGLAQPATMVAQAPTSAPVATVAAAVVPPGPPRGGNNKGASAATATATGKHAGGAAGGQYQEADAAAAVLMSMAGKPANAAGTGENNLQAPAGSEGTQQAATAAAASAGPATTTAAQPRTRRKSASSNTRASASAAAGQALARQMKAQPPTQPVPTGSPGGKKGTATRQMQLRNGHGYTQTLG